MVLALGLDEGEANQLINAYLRVGYMVMKVTLAVHTLILDFVFFFWSETEVGVLVIVGAYHRSGYNLIGVICEDLVGEGIANMLSNSYKPP